MTQLRIDSAELSKSGKSYMIMSGGQKYWAKPEQGLQAHIGDTLDCKVSESEYQGNTMLWINAFKVVQSVPQAPQTPQRYDPNAPAGKVYSASPQAPMWLPMASNLCNAAIVAGIIKTPSELNMWVLGVRHAVEMALEAKPYDEDIKF